LFILKIWARDHYIQVQIDDKKNLEDNHRAALVGCFGEYVDILKSLEVGNTIVIHDKEVKLAELFTEESLTIEQLKERRSIATSLIDQKSSLHTRKAYYINRKVTLLSKEDQLSLEYEQQKRQEQSVPSQKKTYWARMNNTFLRCVGSTSNSIVGCYAPDGDHCEKPIEIGIKANLAIISLFEESKDNENEGMKGIGDSIGDSIATL
jgi:hypothetical protein